MLGIDRRAAQYTWTVALVLLFLLLLYTVRKTLFVFVLAVLFAYLMTPLVNFLDRVLPASRTRAPALALAYALIVGALIVVGIQIGTRVADQANALSKTVPALLEKWGQTSAAPPSNALEREIAIRIRQQFMESFAALMSSLPKASLRVLAVASDLIYVIVVPILSFFFLKDGRAIRQHMLDLIGGGPKRELLEEVLADTHLLLAHYIRALFLLSCATFVFYGIFFSAMRVPYGMLLATLAFALEFIPMVGPLAAAAVIVLVAAASGSHVILILIFLAAYRMFQDYILSPHLMGSGVELHPLVVLFGVFAGAEIAGIPGTFLSVPVLALLRVLYRRLYKVRSGESLSPASSV